MEHANNRFEHAIEVIIKEKPDLAPSILFYADILLLQEQLSEGLIRALRDRGPSLRNSIQEVIKRGKSLIELVGIPYLKYEEWKRIFQEILGVVERYRDELKEELESLSKAAEEGIFSPKELARFSLSGDLNYARGVSVETGVDLDLVSAIALWTLQPVLMAIKKLVDGEELRGWRNGFCPICGSYTRTGYIEGGRNHLKCEVCGMEWPYEDRRCPFCGNEDGKISYQSINKDRFRLYICEKCGEYWKIVNEDVSGKEVPRELYPVWTFELDDLASKLESRQGVLDAEADGDSR
ncbi:MAG: formate dehydrogenase accessory protein FdhE [Candidatus Korarchaeota archaeon]|nr:formate dehydrogenase accessory protein FdhE [Candidatus Korarchaeota archaeon]